MLKLLVLALVLAATATLLTLYLREPQIGGSRAATEPQIPGCASLRVFNGSRGVRDVRLLLRDPLFASLCGARAVDGARGACFRLADGRVVCLPTALLIGFTKAGTTAFFRYAAQHPLVRVSRVKEPNYFGSDAGLVTHVLDDGAEAGAPADAAAESAAADAPPLDDVLDRASAGRASRVAGVRAFGGDKSLAWYTGLFAPACPTCARLEATPSYAWRDYSPRAAIQARALLGGGGGGGGGVALVMLVREPVARALSHYRYFREKRYQNKAALTQNATAALDLALEEFERCATQLKGWRPQCTYREGRRDAEVAAAAIERARPELWRFRPHRRSYELVQAGLYSEHVRTWSAQFGAASLLVLDAALLRAKPAEALRRFERHAGLPPAKYAEDGGGGESSGGGGGAAGSDDERLEPSVEARLRAFFTPFNAELRRLTGVGWEY